MSPVAGVPSIGGGRLDRRRNRTKSALHRAGTAELRTGFLIPFPSPPLPIELQRELHGARIGLYVGNAAECTACLADRVSFALRARRQAVARVRQPQVLMIQRVEHLPAELDVALLGQVE